MNYYLDTEFLEGTQKSWFGINTKPTIDLISIALVAEDGREYYAISKDFNLKEAWNRHQPRTGEGDRNNTEPRLYWIRENVLKPIFDEWKTELNNIIFRLGLPTALNKMQFTYKNFKYCIKCIGKTNKQIAEEIKEFICPSNSRFDGHAGWESFEDTIKKDPPKFYGYYADYDWVSFCWLFGKMNDLPRVFPMYCIDLKQTLDNKYMLQKDKYPEFNLDRLEAWLRDVKKHPNYPKQTDKHHALADAHWNKKLHEFLTKL